LHHGAHRRATVDAREDATVLELACGDVRVDVSPDDGGRLASVVVGGRELLVTEGDGPMMWGAFPMVPWAGRIRRGHFTFAGREYEVPVNLGPHALHGVGFDRPWSVLDSASIRIDFDERWPFGGHAIQRFHLDEAGFTCTMEVHAGQPMPVQAGWHPWFRRPVDLHFDAKAMYVRDDDGIPTGELVPPPPGPWDDCFTDVAAPPRLAFTDGPTVIVSSSCDHWVVYSEPTNALCVEPQSGPPDAFNLAPHVIGPDEPLVVTMTWRW
jgi:aldose 1-epimerase